VEILPIETTNAVGTAGLSHQSSVMMPPPTPLLISMLMNQSKI
jgi:hypothetical protein